MNKLVIFTLLVPLVFSLPACSDASQPDPTEPISELVNTTASASIQKANTETNNNEKKLRLTNPKMMKPAEKDHDFFLQACEYSIDLAIITGMIQKKMQGNVNLTEFKATIQDDIAVYNAGIEKALSIPKPVDKLPKSYDQYISVIMEHKKFPEVLNKALDANDLDLFEEAYAQLNKSVSAYQECLHNIH